MKAEQIFMNANNHHIRKLRIENTISFVYRRWFY